MQKAMDEQTKQQVREIVRDEMAKNKLVLNRPMQVLDGNDMILGKAQGTRIGTGISQKLAFLGSTPIIQRTAAAQAAVSGTADGTYSANEQTLINDLVTLTNELRTSLVNFGLIKGS